MTASRVWDRHAWLQGWALFLPAAVFLFAFTYYPMLSTVFDSFFSTARPRRPSAFIGLDNYTAMFADPIFREALWNNVIYAVATIPSSIALALLMAVWVNGKMRGASAGADGLFHPDHPADDRGGEYLDLLLRAADRAAQQPRGLARISAGATCSAAPTRRSPASPSSPCGRRRGSS